MPTDEMPARWAPRYSWILVPAGIFVASRIALLFVSYFGLVISPSLFEPGGPREFIQQYPALDGFCRWDWGMYERLASTGYWDDGSVTFFPLYPLLVRGLSAATGLHLHFSLLVVSNVASLASFCVIYRVFVRLEGEVAAKWGLAVFASYPFAFFQAAALPESLLTLTTALGILFALRGEHLRAGIAVAAAVLTRQLGLAAGLGLWVAQLRQRGRSAKAFFIHPGLLGLALPVAALAGFCLYQDWKFGSPWLFYTVRARWGPMASWSLVDVLRSKDWNPFTIPIAAYLPFVVLVPSAGAIALIFRRHYELAVFAGGYLVIVLSVGMWGSGRYTSSCWPAFLPAGLLLSRYPSLQPPVVTLLAVCQGFFFYLFSHQYPVM